MTEKTSIVDDMIARMDRPTYYVVVLAPGEVDRIADAVVARLVANYALPPQTNAGDPIGEIDHGPTPRDILTYACGCVLGPDRGWVPCRTHQYVPVSSPMTR